MVATSTIRVDLVANADQMRKTIERQQKQLDGLRQRNKQLTGSNQKVTKSFKDMANGISPVTLGIAGLSAAVGAYATSAVRDFAKVEQGWAEVTTLMQGRSKEFTDALFEDLRSFSIRTGTELGNATRAAYQAISAGIADTNVEEFLDVAAKAARGGIAELDTAVDALTTVLNAYNLETSEATRVSDALFTAVRLGKTTFNELAPALGAVLPLAKEMGIEIEQVTASIAVLTAQGASTPEAVTRIRGAMTALSKETKAKELFEDFTGKTIPEFVAAGGNLQEILTIIKDQGDKLGVDMPTAFGRVEGALATFALAGEENLELFDEAVEGTRGATEEAFGKMEETTAFKIDQMKAKFTELKVDIGEQLGLALVDMTEFAQDINDISPINLDFVFRIRQEGKLPLWLGGVGKSDVESFADIASLLPSGVLDLFGGGSLG